MAQNLGLEDIIYHLQSYLYIPQEKREEAVNLAIKFFGNEKDAYSYIDKFYNFFYKNEELIKENVDFMEEISKKTPNKKAFLTFAKKEMKDENGAVLPLVRQKAIEFLEVNQDINDFNKCYSDCSYNGGFDESLFQKNLVMFLEGPKSLDLEEIKRICNKLKEIAQNEYSPSLETRLKDLQTFKNLDESLKEKMQLDSTIKALESFFEAKIINPIDKTTRKTFLKDVLGANKDNTKLSTFETTLTDSIEELKGFKKGIPLKYSREDFLRDLVELDPADSTFAKLQIDADSPYSYEGLIYLEDLNLDSPEEKRAYDLCHRFLYENEVQTDNEKLNEELNKIIKAAPEFVNTVGKRQNQTHDYTLDIHSLLVLANSINHSDYLNLCPRARAALKMSTILHDINKKEGVYDKGHYNPSSESARNIALKFFSSPEMQNKIFNLVKNHHWLERLEESCNKEEEAQGIAFDFRNENDFEISKIFATADLQSVGDAFFEEKKGSLKNFKLVEDSLNLLYSSGNAIFTHCPNQNANKHGIVNLNEIENGEDLFDYGFGIKKGLSKEELMFLVHMVSDDNIVDSLSTLKELTSPRAQGAISESIITPYQKATFSDRKYGAILSQANPNVINVNCTNQRSGFKKDSESTCELIYNSVLRDNFKKHILKALDVNCSNEEYADFYKKHIIPKRHIGEFSDEATFELGGKTFSEKELLKAIKDFQSSILDKENHNEIVGCTPNIKGIIAKASSIEEVPDELLEFAKNNNLPLVLI